LGKSHHLFEIHCVQKSFKVFTKVELLPRNEVSKKIWERRRELAKVGE
jgi:hypothetical protein